MVTPTPESNGQLPRGVKPESHMAPDIIVVYNTETICSRSAFN